MRYLAHAKEGLLNLYHAKLRAFLALLGVLVGTASVVAMVLGGELATNEALKQFKSLGTDLLAVAINASGDDLFSSSGKSENLSLEEAWSVKTTDDGILKIAPYTQSFQPVYFNGKPLNAITLGVTDSFADIVHVKLLKGRFVSVVDRYEPYCVIGRNVYDKIKTLTHKEPLGSQIQIGKSLFVIVGVADRWPENGFVYANIDSSVLVPLLASTILNKYATINSIIMRLSKESDISTIEDKVRQHIMQFMPKVNVDFRSAKELIAKMAKQSNILTVFLGLIGSISLIVGGIGVMNIMLVSVMERRREIGIRMAVGARGKDIAALFLLESVILSLIGGVVGVMIGIATAYVIALFWDWEFTLFLWPPLAGFSVSVGVGVFFGFYPAYLASKLDPIDALRSD